MTKIKKIVAGITAFACLVGACVGVVAVMDKPIGNQSVDQFAGLVTEQTGSNGMALLMGETLNADGSTVADSVTVTATLTAVEDVVYNEKIYWHIGFKENDEWMADKNVNDYVTMTVAEDTHSVTLDCAEAFGTPIVVTAISAEDPNVSAICQLDYYKRLIGVTDLTINYDTADDAVSYVNYIRFNMENTIKATLNYGVGTVYPKVNLYCFNVRASDAFYAAFIERVPEFSYTHISSTYGRYSDENPQYVESDVYMSSFTATVDKNFSSGGLRAYKNIVSNLIYENAYDAATGLGNSMCDNQPQLFVNCDVKYGGEDIIHKQFESYTTLRWERGALEYITTVTDLNLSQSNIVF